MVVVLLDQLTQLLFRVLRERRRVRNVIHQPALRPCHQTEPIAKLIRVIGLLKMRQANAGASPLNVARAIGHGLMASAQFKPMFSSHCEVAQRLAERLGFKANVVYALGQLYERWDGKGLPKGLKGATKGANRPLCCLTYPLG